MATGAKHTKAIINMSKGNDILSPPFYVYKIS